MTPTLGQVAYEAYWRVHITDGLWHVPPAYATLQAITRESWEAAAQAVQSDVLRYVRAVIRHWNEFGPGYGFAEHMNALETWMEAQWERAVIVLTKQNYPAIYEAFVLIAQDTGRINRLEGSGDAWDVPISYAAQLAPINSALASLGTETLETFCIGEFSEAEAIRTCYALDDARRLLDAFFEGWIPEAPTP